MGYWPHLIKESYATFEKNIFRQRDENNKTILESIMII